MKAMKKRQQGLGMSTFLFAAILLVFVAVFAMKLIPSYMQDGEIQEVFNAIAHDPEMKNASLQDLKMSYAKRASVADISAIKLDDVEFGKDDNGNPLLSASYQVKMPLVANISLLLDFNPSSAH